MLSRNVNRRILRLCIVRYPTLQCTAFISKALSCEENLQEFLAIHFEFESWYEGRKAKFKKKNIIFKKKKEKKSIPHI